MSTVIGIDLGGTKISATRYNTNDWIAEAQERESTLSAESFSVVYEQIVAMVQRLRQPDTVGVGIGVPGLIRQPAGVIHTLPNIPKGEEFPLKSKLEAEFDMLIRVDNDANCFALAESIRGSGEGHSVVIGITLGTGVGGGIILDNKIFHGAEGYSAEVGHMLLQPGMPPYPTEDKRGEVEQFFSGTAMGKRCEAASDPTDYLEGAVCSFMHKDIYKEIAWFLVNIIHLLNPSIIVFGGSAGHAVAKHFDRLKEELIKWLLPGTPLPELTLESLPNSATLGAALLIDSH